MSKNSIAVAAALAALAAGPAAAAPMSIFDFALFGAAGVNTTAGADTQIGSGTIVHGNVGSNEDVSMLGSSEVRGSVYAGRDFTMGNGPIVGSAATPAVVVANGVVNTGTGKIFGDVHASGSNGVGTNNYSLLVGNSAVAGAEITGNVYTKNNLRFNNPGQPANGGTVIGGNATVGGSVTDASANTVIVGTTTTGSTAGLQTFAGITAPAPTPFTSSANAIDDRSCMGACTTLTLGPGTYSDLTVGSTNKSLFLTSGTYKFQSVSVAGDADLFLDLSSGNPLNILVTGLAEFGTNIDVFLKGPGDVGYTQVSAVGANTSLASLVYLETYNRFMLLGSSEWAGTVYASVVEAPGSHETFLGSGVDVWGAFYAYDTVDVAGGSTIHYVRSYLAPSIGGTAVPAPATLLLVGAGLLGLLGRRKLA